MRTILALLFLIASLGLSACTDDGEPSGSPGTGGNSPTKATSSGPASPSETAASDLPPARNACKVLDPEDVGRVLGTAVESVDAAQGCRFANPEDPATTSLGVSQGELAASGGLEGAQTGVATVIDAAAEDLPDVGDGAFVMVGPAFGGKTTTGGGAVALGSSLIQITVIPGPGAADADVRAATVEVLTLIAKKARK